MAIVNKNILNTDTILLEVPVGERYAITAIIVNNYSSSTSSSNDSTFDMHLVKENDNRNNTNKILNNIQMPAQETFTFSLERIILDPGDKVIATSVDSDKLSATISYLEV